MITFNLKRSIKITVLSSFILVNYNFDTAQNQSETVNNAKADSTKDNNAQPLLYPTSTADPSVHVYNNGDYIYPSLNTATGKKEDDLGSHFNMMNGEDLNWYAVAGAGKKFFWPSTRIDGGNVVLWHEKVPTPKYVRYAWADQPIDQNLYNKEGIPAAPSEVELPQPTAGDTGRDLPWNKKQCAVILTYDDGLNVHLSNAMPALDSMGLKGTFYISDYFGGLQAQIPKWKRAALRGHELANHTMHHPCEGGRPGREFVKPQNDLNNYTVQQITNEIKSMNTLLKGIDGRTERTFAFPCADAKIRDTSYIEYSKNEFIAARSVRAEMLQIQKINLFNLPSYMVNGEPGEKLIGLVKEAMQKKAMLIFLFHGVGGEHSLNVSLQAHTELLKFLKQNEKDIWVAPMIDVAAYIKKYQKGSSNK